MIRYFDAEVTYSKENIFKRLRIEKGTQVYDYSDSVFPRLEKIVKNDLEMVQCYTILDKTLPMNVAEVDNSSRQVICLSSCSDKIMGQIQKLIDAGDLLEGYLLNDLVNDILFRGSDQMNRHIAGEVKRFGFRLSHKFSPGENDIPLSFQEYLLSQFREDKKLDYIHLTNSYMLIPEKSMLYINGADPGNPEISVEHDCSQCSNTTCFFRQVKTQASAAGMSC